MIGQVGRQCSLTIPRRPTIRPLPKPALGRPRALTLRVGFAGQVFVEPSPQSGCFGKLTRPNTIYRGRWLWIAQRPTAPMQLSAVQLHPILIWRLRHPLCPVDQQRVRLLQLVLLVPDWRRPTPTDQKGGLAHLEHRSTDSQIVHQALGHRFRRQRTQGPVDQSNKRCLHHQ